MIPIQDISSILQQLPGRTELPPELSSSLDRILAIWEMLPAEPGSGIVNPSKTMGSDGLVMNVQPSDFDLEGLTAHIEVLPEVWIAGIWVRAQNLPVLDIETQLSILLRLAAQPLWEPAQAWVFRLLAASGYRKELAEILPQNGPYTLPQAEAFLEAQFCDGDARLDFVPGRSDVVSFYPEELVYHWMELIQAEKQIYQQDDEVACETLMERLIHPQTMDNQPSWMQAEYCRLAARAGVALIRYRLGKNLGDGGLLDNPALESLPAWERLYLQGLVRWQQGQFTRSSQDFVQSINASPNQSAVRTAYASLLSEQDAQQALGLCSGIRVRQTSIVQTAINIRLGFSHKPEFEQSLRTLNNLPWECKRWSLQSGRVRTMRQERLIQAAFQVRGGNLPAAEMLIHKALPSQQEKNLHLALASHAAWQVRQDNPEDQSWQGERIRQKVQQGQRILAELPPAGNPDFQFFQALLLTETDSAAATKSVRSLMFQKTWRQRELAAGGQRIFCLVDLCLRLRKPELAVLILDGVGDKFKDQEQPRRLVAELLLALQNNIQADELETLIHRVIEFSQNQPGLMLLLVLVKLLSCQNLTVQNKQISDLLRESIPGGVQPPLKKFLECLTYQDSKKFSLLEIQSLPKTLRPAASLLFGDGPLENRLRDYITEIGLDWEVNAPLDAEELARHVLVQLIKANRWDDLHHWLVLFEKTSPVMFNDLTARVRLLEAVRKGLAGDLDAAEAQLIQMEGT